MSDLRQAQYKESWKTQEDLLEKVKSNEVLVTAVNKGTGQLRSLREGGLRWKSKYLASQDDVKGKTQQDLLQTKEKNVVYLRKSAKGQQS
jgi:hypothetical protein